MAKEYAETRRRAIELDEVDLVMAAQKGDLEAFNQLVLRYQERVFNLCVRILGDDDSAENVTQDTFLIAYRSLGRFRNGSFRSWILRIATNACYDELRYRKRHPVRSLEYEDDAEERYFPLYDLPERDTHPEKVYEKQELEGVVHQALGRLEAEQRAVVALVDLQEVEYQEAARILGVPIGTVKSRLARARLQLRRQLLAHPW